MLKFSGSLLILFLIACGSANIGEERLTDEEIINRGRSFTGRFLENRLESLFDGFVDKSFNLKQLTDFRAKVEQQLGSEVNIVNEQAGIFKDAFFYYFYVRYSRFSKFNRPVKTTFSFDRLNRIYSFSVEGQPPEAESKYLDYQTKTELRLPFEGEWDVGAGGRSLNLNQHAVAVDQRFAYDFVIKQDGYSFRTDGKSNKDYYCYNQRILAPGTGTIVTVKNDLKENKPGQMPKTSGNHVVIDHGNGEFSFLSHFKYRSIAVKEGQKVEIGQYLGLCGNSGHSSEPHIHYHLQNTAIFFKGEGLPAQFQSYLADGKKINRGEPTLDQKIKNQLLE